MKEKRDDDIEKQGKGKDEQESEGIQEVEGVVVDPDGSGQEVVKAQFQRYEGPLPHPEHLEKYEEIMPGASDRVFTMLEKEQDHRHASHNEFVTCVVSRERWGQIFGFILGIAALCVTLILALNGYPISGVGLGVVIVGALISIFWWKNKNGSNSSNGSNGSNGGIDNPDS